MDQQKKPSWKLHPKTLEIHGGGSLDDTELREGVSRVAAYRMGSMERSRRLFAGEERGFVYSRIGNKTVSALERRLASMEGAEAGLCTDCGMGAIDLLSGYLAHGGEIVSSNRVYGGTFDLFAHILPLFGIKTFFVENPHDLSAWEKSITKKTKFLYVESPSNPTLDVFDIRALARLAHSHGIPLIVDSTLATPALNLPIQQGADFVIHSISKYMGNGEIIGGVILGKTSLIEPLHDSHFRERGHCMSADVAAITLANIESLTGRMKEHCKNANYIAKFLSNHPKVNQVFYPTFGKRAGINKKLMPKGFGGLLSFEVKGGLEAARIVLENLELFWHAPNIGESRSLILCPWVTTHGVMNDEEKLKAGITPGTLRLSMGREDPRDPKIDLNKGLKLI